jgi:hypothetical protein
MKYSDLGTKEDIRDALKVLDHTGMANRCKGGRIILGGYHCIHCGADPVETCKAPLRGRIKGGDT